MKKFLRPLLFLVISITLAGCDDSSLNQTPKKDYTWQEALELLNDGQVKSVAQAHDLTVVFDLKNGQEFAVKEPSIDAIFEEVNSCGKPCADLELITE
jgi:hypothetical protein